MLESSADFTVKVYTGTINMVPQYKKYNIPKDVFEADKLELFIGFLKQQIGKNYLIKM